MTAHACACACVRDGVKIYLQDMDMVKRAASIVYGVVAYVPDVQWLIMNVRRSDHAHAC